MSKKRPQDELVPFAVLMGRGCMLFLIFLGLGICLVLPQIIAVFQTLANKK